jgi:plastocyanin
MQNGQDYGVGETIIDANKLSMRRNFQNDAPDGVYTVTYNACWPDKSCHDSNFQFAINRVAIEKALDLRNKSEVEIDLVDIKFKPEIIRVSPGTTVLWTNSDEVEHYINTDSHPAHTYFPSQNSKSLSKGDSYSVTFAHPGVYPYHCSAHAGTMAGRIIVG